MSYQIRTIISQEFAPGFSAVNVRDNFFDFTTNTYSFGRQEVAHLKYYEGDFIRGVYGVVQGSGPGATFKFDQEIYPLSSDISASDVIGLSLYSTDEYDKISTINFSSNITNAVYSNEYKVYNTNVDYQVIINQEKRKFFSSFKNTAVAQKMVLVDYCEDYAYGISFDQQSFNMIDNVFNSQLVFNIAKR
jgi:hypothetical protein